jgi:hypothetical protein
MQDAFAILLVVLACIYLGRRTWVIWSRRRSGGCGGCGHCPASKQTAMTPALVSLEMLPTSEGKNSRA